MICRSMYMPPERGCCGRDWKISATCLPFASSPHETQKNPPSKLDWPRQKLESSTRRRFPAIASHGQGNFFQSVCGFSLERLEYTTLDTGVYSYRSATFGSTRAARRAGIQQANTP